MTRTVFAAALALLAASPAEATGGLLCSTAGARPIELSLVIGHTVVPSLVSARLRDDGREVPVIVAQSWLEPNEIRLDLTDGNALQHELRLRAKRKGDTYDGSLWRHGKRRWVRCSES